MQGCYLIHAGKEAELPKEKDLLGAGVLTFETAGGQAQEQSAQEQISKLLSTLEGGEANGDAAPHTPLLSMGAGLSAIPKKLVAKILSNEYVDFTEFPPAKGKGRPMPHSFEGQIIVVQAADLIQSRKIIPDLATWVQCFSLYVATLATKSLGRIPDLMAYQTSIAKASQKYRCPAGLCMTKTSGRKQLAILLNLGQKSILVSMPNASPARQ